jgi:lipid II isoglutaminyl synthase (glutamine-hydrolysing)
VNRSPVRIVVLYPELLGTYGDGGNAVVLAQRLRWRGIAVQTQMVAANEPVPDDADLYVLGGGEDGPQAEAARELARQGSLHRAIERGAAVFGVCAGMQLLGTSFPGAGGTVVEGLGLLDCSTERTGETRAVGELLVTAEPSLTVGAAGLGELTGFENHAGRTRVGSGARPLGTVVAGVGNGSVGVTADGIATEGAVSRHQRVIGTYLHGPALARNPALADLVLGWVVDDLPPLDADHNAIDGETTHLRAERLAAVRAGNLDGVLRRTWRDRLLGRN